jgi:hypothetical protein
VDSERALKNEFRRALDDVLPPAPWLPTTVSEGLREERRRRSWRMGSRRPVIVVRLPQFSQKVAAAALIVVLLVAAVGVFLVTHRQANQSVPAGLAPPQAMPSGTQDLKAGTYAFAYPKFDAPGKPFPNVLITVPDGWSSYEGFAVLSLSGTPRELAVSVWNVVDVYATGCHWAGPMIHPGPTVDELAAMFAARPLRNATAPVAVSLGGYQGKYLEWSVPADTNFSDCDGGFFKSWNDAVGDRYQQGPGQVDWLWILDVEGHRLVVDATYMPAATEQDRAELAGVVSSIAFKR